jgi:hypothetical protein
MLVDDDTYIFYEGLATNVLSRLPDPLTNQHYTGEIAPRSWFPVHYNGGGTLQPGVGVGTFIPFVLGGGGSLFSWKAVNAMLINNCILESRENMLWETYLSDWMLGACASRYGTFMSQVVPPNALSTQTSSPYFNQFVCADPDRRKFRYCKETTAERAGDKWPSKWVPKQRGGIDMRPCSLHPVKDRNSTYFVRNALAMTHPKGGIDLRAAFERELSKYGDIGLFYDAYTRYKQDKQLQAQASKSEEAAETLKVINPHKPGSLQTAWLFCDQCPGPMQMEDVPLPGRACTTC